MAIANWSARANAHDRRVAEEASSVAHSRSSGEQLNRENLSFRKFLVQDDGGQLDARRICVALLGELRSYRGLDRIQPRLGMAPPERSLRQ